MSCGLPGGGVPAVNPLNGYVANFAPCGSTNTNVYVMYGNAPAGIAAFTISSATGSPDREAIFDAVDEAKVVYPTRTLS